MNDGPDSSSLSTQTNSLDALSSLGLPVTWTPVMEIHLFHAMAKLKPVGIHKHFRMLNIYRQFNRHSPIKRSTQQLWEHIKSLVDLPALEELTDQSDSETETRVSKKGTFIEFSLPLEEFDLIKKEEVVDQKKEVNSANNSEVVQKEELVVVNESVEEDTPEKTPPEVKNTEPDVVVEIEKTPKRQRKKEISKNKALTRSATKAISAARPKTRLRNSTTPSKKKS